jgi:hypothetical protein
MLESLLFGTLVIISTTYLDAIGLEYEFWVCPTQLLPLAPRAVPFDMSIVQFPLYSYINILKLGGRIYFH